MPTLILSFKKDDRSMAHVFFGAGKSAAEAAMHGHAEICPKYGPAFRAQETVEYLHEIDELPPTNVDELAQWVDELLSGLQDAEGDEDEAIDVSGGPEDE
jgi:hypothetical protein